MQEETIERIAARVIGLIQDHAYAQFCPGVGHNGVVTPGASTDLCEECEPVAAGANPVRSVSDVALTPVARCEDIDMTEDVTDFIDTFLLDALDLEDIPSHPLQSDEQMEEWDQMVDEVVRRVHGMLMEEATRPVRIIDTQWIQPLGSWWNEGDWPLDPFDGVGLVEPFETNRWHALQIGRNLLRYFYEAGGTDGGFVATGMLMTLECEARGGSAVGFRPIKVTETLLFTVSETQTDGGLPTVYIAGRTQR